MQIASENYTYALKVVTKLSKHQRRAHPMLSTIRNVDEEQVVEVSVKNLIDRAPLLSFQT